MRFSICPKCGCGSFLITGNRGSCHSCGYQIVSTPKIPLLMKIFGKKKSCPFCGKVSFKNGKCKKCGAEEVSGTGFKKHIVSDGEK